MERGTRVSWEWQGKKSYGHIQETYTRTIIKTIQGTEIVRHGTPDEPAYLIIQEDGTPILKCAREVCIEKGHFENHSVENGRE